MPSDGAGNKADAAPMLAAFCWRPRRGEEDQRAGGDSVLGGFSDSLFSSAQPSGMALFIPFFQGFPRVCRSRAGLCFPTCWDEEHGVWASARICPTLTVSAGSAVVSPRRWLRRSRVLAGPVLPPPWVEQCISALWDPSVNGGGWHRAAASPLRPPQNKE